jgi:hypothetical protein
MEGVAALPRVSHYPGILLLSPSSPHPLEPDASNSRAPGDRVP